MARKNRYTGEICTSYSSNNTQYFTGDSLHKCYCYANWDPCTKYKISNEYQVPVKIDDFLNGTFKGKDFKWSHPTDYDFLKHVLKFALNNPILTDLRDYALNGLGLTSDGTYIYAKGTDPLCHHAVTRSNNKNQSGELSAPVCGSFENNSNKWKYYACLKYRNIDEKNKRNFFKDKDIPKEAEILDHIQVNQLKNFIDSEITNRKKNKLYNDLSQQNIKNQNVGDLVDSKYPQKILDAAKAIYDTAKSLDSDDTIYKNTENNIDSISSRPIQSEDETKADQIDKLFYSLSNIYKDCICYSDCGQYAEKVCRNYGSCGCNYY